MDLSVLGGYFIYNCNHSVVSQCPLYRVERLSVSRRLEIHAIGASELSVYRGCPHLGGSVKRGSTVHYISCRTGYKHLHSKHVNELLNNEPFSDHIIM